MWEEKTRHSLRVLILVLATTCGSLSPSLLGDEHLPAAPKWALQIGLSRDLRASGFQGTRLSLERADGRNAWQFGASVNWSGSTTNTEFSSMVAADGSAESQVQPTHLTLAAQRILAIGTGEDVRVCAGFGPQLSCGFYSSEPGDDDFPAISREVSIYSVGARVLMRAEYRITEEFGVLGEYATVVAYRWSRDTERVTYHFQNGPVEYTQVDRENEFGLDATLSLAVSFHF